MWDLHGRVVDVGLVRLAYRMDLDSPVNDTRQAKSKFKVKIILALGIGKDELLSSCLVLFVTYMIWIHETGAVYVGFPYFCPKIVIYFSYASI